MNVDITKLIEGIIAVLVFIITTFVIPYIRVNVKGKRLEEIVNWVKIAVQAAELIYKESGMGAFKKEYVIQFMESKGYKIDTDTLDALIESAVLELKNAMEAK